MRCLCRGLDREAIKRKALQQGIRSQSEVDQLSDRQVHELILLSGFSTAAGVTDYARIERVLTEKPNFEAEIALLRAFVDPRSMEFLYQDSTGYVFMDKENYEQLTLPEAPKRTISVQRAGEVQEMLSAVSRVKGALRAAQERRGDGGRAPDARDRRRRGSRTARRRARVHGWLRRFCDGDWSGRGCDRRGRGIAVLRQQYS